MIIKTNSLDIDGEIGGGQERREAWFSDCERYRYLLDIVWAPELPMMTTIALNPSIADELVNDNTVVRVKTFARQWGFGGHRMLNAFAWRETKRLEIFRVKDPIGPDNTVDFLSRHSTPKTMAAWGVTIQSKRWPHWYRGHDIAEAIPGLLCYGLTADKHPIHPLYLPGDTVPMPFSYDE